VIEGERECRKRSSENLAMYLYVESVVVRIWRIFYLSFYCEKGGGEGAIAT
jgi:hypothetical protein